MNEEKTYPVQKWRLIIHASEGMDLSDTALKAAIEGMVLDQTKRQIEAEHPGCKFILLEIEQLDYKPDQSPEVIIMDDARWYIIATVKYAIAE